MDYRDSIKLQNGLFELLKGFAADLFVTLTFNFDCLHASAKVRLRRFPTRTLKEIDGAIAFLATRPDLRPVSRSAFVRYAVAYVVDQLAEVQRQARAGEQPQYE